MAKYDIPSWIEYIKAQTGQDKLNIIAHSQGSQQMLYNLIKNRTYFKENVKFLTVLSGFEAMSPSTLTNYVLFNYFKWISPIIEPLRLFKAFPLWLS